MSINLLKLLTQKQPNHFERFAKAYQFELKEEQRRQARFNNIEGYNRTIEESYIPDLATKIRVEGPRNERFIERPQTPQIFLPQVIPQVLQVPQVLRIYQSPAISPNDVFLDAPTELPSLILEEPTIRIANLPEQGTARYVPPALRPQVPRPSPQERITRFQDFLQNHPIPPGFLENNPSPRQRGAQSEGPPISPESPINPINPMSPSDVFLDAPIELPSLILGEPTIRIEGNLPEQGTETLDIQNNQAEIEEIRINFLVDDEIKKMERSGGYISNPVKSLKTRIKNINKELVLLGFNSIDELNNLNNLNQEELFNLFKNLVRDKIKNTPITSSDSTRSTARYVPPALRVDITRPRS